NLFALYERDSPGLFDAYGRQQCTEIQFCIEIIIDAVFYAGRTEMLDQANHLQHIGGDFQTYRRLLIATQLGNIVRYPAEHAELFDANRIRDSTQRQIPIIGIEYGQVHTDTLTQAAL